MTIKAKSEQCAYPMKKEQQRDCLMQRNKQVVMIIVMALLLVQVGWGVEETLAADTKDNFLRNFRVKL